ncbi:helix-turn-helix domain-containing protein [Dyadobacter sp. LJ53]|uniref:helix-turn-helix domain-containing protein n=1 Tax=Dyadobacter chenwenxiniae TaxID=2906456 RepID=UPI001F1747DF|nr:helix-turn-helix domain-containing protein [Dyadobacter chenwenxiniae]MCF0049278.1 helix-turn-helix domain-containing protein [Dyadobacter chenwenxiniae]
MSALKPLSDFFDAIEKDARINSTHIGIYAALLQHWNRQGCPDRLEVFSYELIGLAKLSSRDTYFKYIRELSEYGYIRYERSFNRNKPSAIYLFR